MSDNKVRLLFVTIAVLGGTIVGILAGVLAIMRGDHPATAISEGGMGFAGATALILLLFKHLRVI
ncbi:hypothetical protein ACFVMC_12210 [Nocardia sp. NPDC127579]|uniref:hypothetical protein n=1 Tax=Nocardia sp. NPDC127579 TaxID=3345402 RepID=UPI003633ED9F